MPSKTKIKLQLFFAVILIVFFVNVGTWVIIRYHDLALRKDLLKKSQLLASIIHADQLKRLQGNETDLLSDNYLNIKKQLAFAARSIARIKFLYITGINPDGEVFFYADNELPGSADESPPGQLYPEASDQFKKIFVNGRSIVEGPFSDRWGIWITALSPIRDEKTGHVIAVLGMDIAAHDWQWDIAAHSAVPAAIFAIFLIIAFSRFFQTQQPDLTPKPVLKRLLWPLSIVIGVIIISFITLLWQQQNSFLKKRIARTIAAIPQKFQHAIKQESDNLLQITQSMADDAALQKTVLAKAKGEIPSVILPLFNDLNPTSPINAFYLLDTNRKTLFALHDPRDEDKVISEGETFTAAQQLQKPASGIQLDASGELILHIVQPVLSADQLIGYIIVTKHMADILDNLLEPDIDLAIALRKDQLPQKTLKRVAPILTKKFDENNLSNYLFVYSSTKPILQKIPRILHEHIHYSYTTEVAADDKIWRVSLVPLSNIAARAMGDMIIFHDITDQQKAFRRTLRISGGLLAVLLTALFSFLFTILRWTDNSILRNQRQLLENEKNYRELINGMNETVWVLNLDGTILDVNDRTIEVLGYSKKELLTKKLYMIDKQLTPETIDQKIRTMPSHKMQTFETSHTTKDGKVIPVEINSSLILYQGKPAILSIARDISERKKAEESLKASEARFQSVVSNVPGVIFRCRKDAHWTMEFLSPMIADITGYQADDLLQNRTKSFVNIIHPDDTQQVSASINEALSNKKSYSIAYRIISRSGETKWVQENGRGFIDERQGITYIDGVIVDITHQKQMEENMRYLKDQLTQSKKMAAIGKLSAGVAHEIKNPLAIILLSIDALEHAVTFDENNQKMINMIRASAERANKIVIDLLNFSRQQKLHIKPTQPVPIIQAAVSEIQSQPQEKNGLIINEIHHVPKNVVIDADPILMEHALLNILYNARDALPQGGTIQIQTDSLFDQDAQNGNLIITITDSGSGIPEDLIDRIFDPFVTTKAVGQGTGLGLSMVYAIIDRHGGSITAANTPDSGAVFTINLPCRKENAA